MITDYHVGKRILVTLVGIVKGPVNEFTVLELSPTKAWVKLEVSFTTAIWKKNEEIEIIEVLSTEPTLILEQVKAESYDNKAIKILNRISKSLKGIRSTLDLIRNDV